MFSSRAHSNTREIMEVRMSSFRETIRRAYKNQGTVRSGFPILTYSYILHCKAIRQRIPTKLYFQTTLLSQKMKLAAISTLFALSAVGTCSALAPRQAPASAASFYFEGPFVSTGNYANFTQCVPEDGHTYSISNSHPLPSLQ